MKTTWAKIAARIREFLDRLGEDYNMGLTDGWTAFSVGGADFDNTDDILFA